MMTEPDIKEGVMRPGKEHPHVDLPGIADGVDVEVADLVSLLNKIPGVTTTSSCQGNPRLIDGTYGFWGHVTVRIGRHWLDVCHLLFNEIRSCMDEKTKEDVNLEVDWNGEVSSDEELTTHGCAPGFCGWIYFRNEALSNLTGCIRRYCLERDYLRTTL